MEKSSYANRGQKFEWLIRATNEQYKRDGTAIVCKIPTEILPIRGANGKVVTSKIGSKSSVDFLGRLVAQPIAIEAKHTQGKSIRFDAVQPHQADFLEAFGKSGVSIVLLSFGMTRFFAVPWEFWRDARKERCVDGNTTTHKRVLWCGMCWDIPRKKSANIGELLPEWEVERKSGMFLDYAATVDKWRY